MVSTKKSYIFKKAAVFSWRFVYVGMSFQWASGIKGLKGVSVSIHYEKIHPLAVEMYKTKNDLAPDIASGMFCLQTQSAQLRLFSALTVERD